MTTESAKNKVLAKYRNAWLSRSPTSPLYYVVPFETAIGSIGMGSTPARAWKNAADCIAAN